MKFSSLKKQEFIITDSKAFCPARDANGNVLSGDELIKKMADAAVRWEKTFNRPVPVPDQSFVAWLKQYKTMRDKGENPDDIIQKTVVQTI